MFTTRRCSQGPVAGYLRSLIIGPMVITIGPRMSGRGSLAAGPCGAGGGAWCLGRAYTL